MASARTGVECPRKLWYGLVLVASMLTISRVAWAQYPSAPQITRDGTAVLLEDYASLPLSSLQAQTDPPTIDFQDQLGRANSLSSEPAHIPQSSSRFFVVAFLRHRRERHSVHPGQGQQSVHAVCQFCGSLSEIRASASPHFRAYFHCLRPGICEKRQILHRAHGKPSQERIGGADQHAFAALRSNWIHANPGRKCSGGLDRL